MNAPPPSAAMVAPNTIATAAGYPCLVHAGSSRADSSRTIHYQANAIIVASPATVAPMIIAPLRENQLVFGT